MEDKGPGWVADCSKFPSEKNCQLYMWAPENQKEDLIDAAYEHATGSVHRNPATPELRAELEKMLEPVA